MKILLSGSHGLIGTELKRQLEERGDEVVRLVRHNAGRDDVVFDLRRMSVDRQSFENFDAFVHLGGVNIGERRLTESRKQAIWDSRLGSTEFLTRIMSELRQPPATFVCASAVGYYGDREDEELVESSGLGKGFFAGLCQYWEEAAQAAAEHGVRVVSLRSGVVLSKDGGALKRQIPLFKLAIGGRLGSGHQWMSWIHLHDEVRAIMHILDTSSLSGPVNITSPQPVKNGYYTAALAQALNRPAFIPTPRPLLVMALGATLTDELLLTSQRVIPEKLIQSGFEFEFGNIHDAFEDALAEPAEPETERLPEIRNPDADLVIEPPEEWTPRD